MTVVIDASVVVGALLDSGGVGDWAEHHLASDWLAAPQSMPVEVANVLRRLELSGEISSESAADAQRDLLDLPVDLYPYEPVADRVWELRHTITAYDAWYVVLAESLDVDLVTLDRRLAAASGPTCRFQTPPV